MITVDEALKIIVASRMDYGTQTVSLREALGGRCARPVEARLTMPPFDASAMDGYAVRVDDATLGATLSVIGEAPAGTPYNGVVSAGEAVRIFTGGPLPDGADTIVIQENVSREDNHITINQAAEPGRHIRKAGIDFHEGDSLVEAGRIIGPADIALAASGNHADITIHRRPKVAIIANGDELRPPGCEIGAGQIISSNSAGLSALIRDWGGEVMDMGIAQDSLESITSLIEAARDADVIVPVGGASVGDYDYMKQAFESLGYDPLFSKTAVKPGKPTWFGTLGNQRVLGLPGNPASANVCAHLFLKPLLGYVDNIFLVSASLDRDISANGPRETYLRGRLYISENGQLTATPFPRQDSSLITPLTESNALIQLPANLGPWPVGETIQVMPLGLGPSIV